MAEQIVLHVRLVNNLIFCAVEDAPDQLFIGGCTRQLSNGDLFQVDGDYPVSLPMPGRKCKGKQDVLFRQCRRQCSCLYVVAHKNDVFRPVRPQRVQNGIQLRITQNHKDHIVRCIRCKFGHHRNAADRGAERKFVLDPQPVLLDLRCPVSPRKQGDILSCAQQISCQIASQNACTIYQNFHAFVSFCSSFSVSVLASFRQTNHAMPFTFSRVTAVYMCSSRFFKLETVS